MRGGRDVEAVEKCGADDSSAKQRPYTIVTGGRGARTTSEPNSYFSTASACAPLPKSIHANIGAS